MMEDPLISDIFDEILSVETDCQPSARSIRIEARRRMERVASGQALSDVIGEPPAVGEQIHVLSKAKFDFWTWVPQMVDWKKS